MFASINSSPGSMTRSGFLHAMACTAWIWAPYRDRDEAAGMAEKIRQALQLKPFIVER